MGKFEQAFAELNIELLVLPLVRPKCNGVVERVKGAFKEVLLLQRPHCQHHGRHPHPTRKSLRQIQHLQTAQNLGGLIPTQPFKSSKPCLILYELIQDCAINLDMVDSGR